MKTSGEDVDDEEFTITILFDQFVKSEVPHNIPIDQIQQKAQVNMVIYLILLVRNCFLMNV